MLDYELAYTEVDWQLLFELRIALIQQRPLPLPVLRILRARGWIRIPPPGKWVHVRAALVDSQEEIEALSSYVACPILLPVGRRELALHRQSHDDEFMEDVFAGEMDGGVVDDCDDEEED